MGARMAMNLLKQHKNGPKLYIYDKMQSTDAFKELVASGATPVPTVGDIVANCRTIISMVPASAHVRELYLGDIIPSLREPSLLIDCSTIDPTTVRAVFNEGKLKGHTVIDAPVSGGVKGAEAGTLTFMVGTELSEADFEGHIKPLLAPMGNAIYCGKPGMGQSVKICNNLILGSQMMGVAEGYRLAASLGVDLGKFNEIVNSSTGQCWTTSKYNPVPGLMDGVPASRDYKGGFTTDLMIKDLGLAMDAAKSAGVEIPVTEFTRAQYKRASEGGFGSLDFGSIFKWFSK